MPAASVTNVNLYCQEAGGKLLVSHDELRGESYPKFSATAGFFGKLGLWPVM
jgi:hypothetical protein